MFSFTSATSDNLLVELKKLLMDPHPSRNYTQFLREYTRRTCGLFDYIWK
jgi:hypothetical protein